MLGRDVGVIKHWRASRWRQEGVEGWRRVGRVGPRVVVVVVRVPPDTDADAAVVHGDAAPRREGVVVQAETA